jgi:hypothetical protein
MILSALSTIFGSPSVISKGLELIDDAFESDEEKRESKTKAKLDLMKAYAPFKVAQRYLALMFGGMFVLSFFLVLGMTLAGFDVDPVFVVLEKFKVGWVMMSIVTFYFGGGLVESFGNKKD